MNVTHPKLIEYGAEWRFFSFGWVLMVAGLPSGQVKIIESEDAEAFYIEYSSTIASGLTNDIEYARERIEKASVNVIIQLERAREEAKNNQTEKEEVQS